MRALFLITIGLALIGGCETKIGGSDERDKAAGHLVLRDVSGNVVATGDLRLPDQLPRAGSFQGSWMLLSSTSAFPASAVSSGEYHGTVHDGQVWIDLNPNVRDNNIQLVGSMFDGTLSGQWEHATIAGAKKLGTFTISVAAAKLKVHR